MLYREYQNKMQRVEDFLLKLWHFRFLILAVVVAALTFVITMTSVAGIVSDATECPPEIVYGEENPYRAKAVFQNVRYEYRSENSGAWTEDVPRRIGSYWVRAVSEGAGKKGEAHFFRIIPRAIKVGVKKDWVYGETPAPAAVPVEGETVVCTQFTYRLGEGVFSSPYGKAYITPVQEDVRILRGEEDVTDCYSVSVTEDEVRVTPRKLTITVKNAEKVYDGTPLSCSEYEITEGSLAFDDELELEFPTELVDAGKVQNVPQVQVIGDGTTRNDFYAVRVVAGELSVTKRPLSVTVGNRQKEYDGTPLEAGGALPEGSDVQGLVAGHSIEISGTESILTVGSATFKPDVTVLDSDGEDVTKNYASSVTAGTLTVIPRPIVLSTPTVEWTYDGDPQIKTQESDCILRYAGSDPGQTEALAEGDSWRIFRTGPCYNDCLEADGGPRENGVLIMIGNEQTSDVRTDCYFITYEYGTVLTMPRPITVISHDRTWQYDGQPHGCTEEDIELSPTSMELVTRGTETDRIVFSEALSFVTDVKDSPIENSFTVTVRNGEGEGYDMSKYYDISYFYGRLFISPRPVAFRSADLVWEYDGKRHSARNADCFFLEEGSLPLVEGHKAMFQHASQAYISEIDQSPVENAFSAWCVEEESERDVTDNYEIETHFGTLSIVPRKLSVRTASARFEYDGEPHTKTDGFEAVDPNSLLAGHSLVLTGEPVSITDVGKVKNWLLFTVADASGRDVSRYYEIEAAEFCGDLEVYPRPITVKTDSGSFVYDGKPHVPTLVQVTSEKGTVKGQQVVFAGMDGDPLKPDDRITVGVWTNRVKVSIEDPSAEGDARYKTGNYEIAYEYGSVTITQRKIKLSSPDVNAVYDGEPKRSYFAEIKLVEGEIADGQRQFLTTFTERTDVGSEKNIFTCDIFSENKTIVTSNYAIEYEYGTIEITPRHVEIVTASNSDMFYDGQEQSYPYFTYGQTSPYRFVDKHSVHIVGATIIREAGSKKNEFRSVMVLDEMEREVTSNYRISIENSGVLFMRYRLIITLFDVSKVYDGTPLSYRADDWYIEDGDNLGNLTVGFTLRGSLQTPGSLDMELIRQLPISVSRYGSVLPKSYYTVEFSGTPLTIRKRHIEIATDSVKKSYDGTPLTAPGWRLSFGSLAAGHTIEVTVTGRQDVPGTSENKIGKCTVYDARHNDVTACYEIIYKPGTLELIE